MDDFTPQRIVSLQPSATLILHEVGELARVVACTRYCAEVCPAAGEGNRLLVADSWTAQVEQIRAARPDLVIASVPYQERAVIEILKSGSRFLGLVPRTLTDIYSDVAMIGSVVGAADRAQQIITRMRSCIQSVRDRAAQTRMRPRVFCEEWGKPLIASQPWVKELVEAAGGEFVGDAGKQITAEDVCRANPEVLIAAWCGAGDRVPLAKIVRERGWSETTAARQGRVYCISDPLLNTPATTLLSGLRALAWALHPSLFPKTEGIHAIVRS